MAYGLDPVTARVDQESRVVRWMVNRTNGGRSIVGAPVCNTCPPKCIYGRSIWGFEAPVAAVIRLRFVAELYRKVAAIWMFAIASLTVPQPCL